jgi:ankyrin repeat protein
MDVHNADSKGDTALILAAQFGSVDIVKLIIAKGA